MGQVMGGSASRMLAPESGAALGARLRQADDRAGFLARVTRTLSGAMQTARAVDLVLDLLTGSVVEWAQVVLVDRRRLLCRAERSGGTVDHDGLPVDGLAPGSSLAGVLASGRTDRVLVPGRDGDAPPALDTAVPCAPLRETLAALRPAELLTIALRARGTTYGALTVARPAGDGFDEAAVAFLEDVAQHVAVTLDTTRAVAESRRVAAVLSRDLVPPVLPSLAGVEMAAHHRVAIESDALGGDFYDVHGDDEEWTAVMGDVCGKGVEAAVLTGRVRQTIRTAALVDRDPAAVLTLTNRTLLAERDDTFVTVVCVRGRQSGDHLVLDVAAAGHPPPLVVRQDGTVEEVAASGTVLGLLDGPRPAVVPVRLAPGETCLVYTDGVPEAPGRRDRFGEERLRAALASTGACHVKAQVEALALAVATHLRDRDHDDIAILALQASP